MAEDLSNVLVVGVSSLALFDLEADNEIFENEGLKIYTDRQLTNQFPIIKTKGLWILAP
jgi:5'-nucleotidase